MQFTFTPPDSAVARDFLERASKHLATLSPAAREAWFRQWLPYMWRAAVRDGVSPADKLHVLDTLERWRDLSKEAA
jgi:hypothetical protein